ncbi:MAG: hypothetical protein AAGC65_12565 [Mucilaginibacter sp.]|uniref:hypothetical protein n=1 Tax=Mucilaginibacter sp. TaxID=1882438 RepID=UPI0031ADA298
MELRAGLGVINSATPDKPSHAGTLGGPVYDQQGNLRLLTCFHCVFAGGFDWDSRRISTDHPFVSVNDNGDFKQAAKIIDVMRDPFVDIALLEPLPGHTVNREIGPWGIPKSSRAMTEDERNLTWLKKIGQKDPNITYARFDGFRPYFGDNYEGEQTMFYLRDLLQITSPTVTHFSVVGDSGSFVLDSDNHVVGMIVMGQDHTSFAIKAAPIERNFNIKFAL